MKADAESKAVVLNIKGGKAQKLTRLNYFEILVGARGFESLTPIEIIKKIDRGAPNLYHRMVESYKL